jgi:hypothetical protein
LYGGGSVAAHSGRGITCSVMTAGPAGEAHPIGLDGGDNEAKGDEGQDRAQNEQGMMMAGWH